MCDLSIVDEEINYVADEDEEYWMENEIEKDVEDNFHVEDSPQLPMFSDNSPERQKAIALSMWMIGFLITLQAKFCFPDKAFDYMVRFLKAFFYCITVFPSSQRLQ